AARGRRGGGRPGLRRRRARGRGDGDARAPVGARRDAGRRRRRRPGRGCLGGIGVRRSLRPEAAGLGRGTAARPGVALDSVASVEEAPAQAVGDARVNGDPGVVLRVIRQPDVDVIRLTRELEAALAAARHALPPAVRVEPAMVRQASFIEHAIGNLSRALLVGAVLVTIVLLLFLGDARAALVSVVAMPLSLLSAVALLRALGATINVMVLGGLAIAVGEVVDDAIIDVENAWRRLRGAPPGSDGDRVVVAALVEVRSAVVYATLIVALVFVPVF